VRAIDNAQVADSINRLNSYNRQNRRSEVHGGYTAMILGSVKCEGQQEETREVNPATESDQIAEPKLRIVPSGSNENLNVS
jgi:hypothetical protein